MDQNRERFLKDINCTKPSEQQQQQQQPRKKTGYHYVEQFYVEHFEGTAWWGV
jgi:hypothetical protein